MPSSARAGTFLGIGQGADSLARLLLGMGQQRKQDERLAKQDAMAQEGLDLNRQTTLARLLAGGFREGVSPDATGTVEVGGTPYSFVPKPAEPEPVNWQTVTTDQGIVQVHPRTGETRPTGLQPPAPRPAPEGPVNWQTTPTADGLVQVNPRTGEVRPLGIQPPASTKTNDKLTQVQPAYASLDNYEGLVREFMGLGRLERGAAVAGVGNQDLVGRISAAQNAFLLNIKNLAELGVLNGPDLQIVTDLIGNPLTADAIRRNPEFVLSRLDEARKFLDQKTAAIGGTPPGAATPTASTPAPQMIQSPVDFESWRREFEGT